MNWRQQLTADPNVLVGKPVVAGTRISVELILDLLAAGYNACASTAPVRSSEPRRHARVPGLRSRRDSLRAHVRDQGLIGGAMRFVADDNVPRASWAGEAAVIERDRERIRALPPSLSAS